MTTANFMCRALVLIALLAASSAEARSHRRAAASDAFDSLLLSLSIAPAFCALSPANQAKDECRMLTAAAFEQTPLTVHGLWPNRAGLSVNLQPHDCSGPPLGPLPKPLEADQQRYIPGGSGLEQYEWRKHGTCSGLSPQAYFSAIVDLARKANETIGSVMRQQGMLGQFLRAADLIAVVAARDPALAAAIVVDCRQPSGGGDALVEEIRIVLSRSLQPMPASSVGLG